MHRSPIFKIPTNYSDNKLRKYVDVTFMSIKRLTSFPGRKGIPLQLHSRMVAVGLKPIIYSALNKHMGPQCQTRHHRTAQKIKYNVPKQETYPRNTVSLNGATGAVSIQPCRFFDADPRKWNKLWGTCKDELFLRNQKRERKYGILKNRRTCHVQLAPCRDRRCPSSCALCGRNLSGADEAGWK